MFGPFLNTVSPNRNTSSTVVAAAAAVTTVAAVAVGAWWWHVRRTENRKSTQTTAAIGIIREDTAKEFEGAASRIRRCSPSSLRDAEKLVLYGLYKQATAGDAPAMLRLNGSSWSDLMTAQAKYTGWRKLRGMSKQEAAEQYVAVVKELESSSSGDGRQRHDGDADAPVGDRTFAPVMSRPAVVENGVDDDDDDTPEGKFLSAAGRQDKASLERFVQQGIDVNHADGSGQTALHLVADGGCAECLRLLLRRGATVNKVDDQGISALQTAVIAGHADICDILLKAGADPDQEDVDGDSPRSCARDDGSPEMKRLFDV